MPSVESQKNSDHDGAARRGHRGLRGGVLQNKLAILGLCSDPDVPCRWVFLSPLLAIAAPQVCPFPFPGATKVAASASVGPSPLRDHQGPSVHHVGVIVLQVSLSNPLPQKDR